MFYFDSSKTYPTETRSEVLIRFQDCDPLRHLNNAKYFDYYFNAREDQVPKVYHIENTDIYKQYGSIWVVYNHQIAYLKICHDGRVGQYFFEDSVVRSQYGGCGILYD